MLLILAIIWLMAALTMFIGPLVNPAMGRFTIRGTDIDFAWLALAASGYFFLRWWTGYLRKHTEPVKRPVIRRQKAEEPQAPIPEFMFDKPMEPDAGPAPPTSPNGRQTDHPA